MNVQNIVDALAVGKTCNVLMNGQSMMRTVTRIERRKEKGRTWLYWYWNPTGVTPWGTNDCGFSGIDLAAHGCK